MKIRRKGNELIIEKSLRCYVKKEGDHYFACCIDICMGEQGDTIEEAKNNLNELITAHIQLAIPDLRPGEQLFKPAPFSFRVEYYYIWLVYNVVRCLRRLRENRSTTPENQVFSCHTPAVA